jgi:hypothetical protein
MRKSRRARFFLVLELSLWAILLDGLSIIGLVVCIILYLHNLPLIFIIALLLITLFLFSQGIKIHTTTATKLRAYALLIQRNTKGIRVESFKPYMNAPCGRVLVRIVLRHLGLLKHYIELKQTYQKAFCMFTDTAGQ